MWKYYVSALVIVGILSLGYVIYNNNQKKMDLLIKENIVYKNAAEQNEKAYNQILEDVDDLLTEQSRVNKDQQKINSVTNKLLEKLRRHDMGKLAQEKPKLIENIVNDASNDVNRCIEILSGSPLTMEEINATKPSEINRSCSNIANPNYVE
jgi:uncharacterized protein YaaW (UPF0174 family)